MAADFPDSITSFDSHSTGDIVTAEIVTGVQEETKAIIDELGKRPSGNYTTLEDRLDVVSPRAIWRGHGLTQDTIGAAQVMQTFSVNVNSAGGFFSVSITPTNGTEFTINTAGVYSFTLSFFGGAVGAELGAGWTVNSTSTTNSIITGMGEESLVMVTRAHTGFTDTNVNCHWMGPLVKGDFIRPMCGQHNAGGNTVFQTTTALQITAALISPIQS